MCPAGYVAVLASEFSSSSPFSRQNHIHHLLLDKGFFHKAITFCLVTINAVMIACLHGEIT